MAMNVTYWDRRDGADRASLAEAAFELCRSQREVEGVIDSRYYWAGPDTIVIQTETAKNIDWTRPEPIVARNFFELADLARETRVEQWMEPEIGEDAYRRAGRAT